MIKRMEAHGIRHLPNGSPRRFLLAMSFDMSSYALLHILNQHLEAQLRRTGRVSYEIRPLFVEKTISQGLHVASDMLEDRYPRYPIVVLHVLLPEEAKTMSELDESLHRVVDVSSLGYFIKSKTSYEDLRRIARQRCFLKEAEHNRCETILWSANATDLAQDILSATAKGRGGTLSLELSDSPSLSRVRSVHPLGDILESEIEAYTDIHGIWDDLLPRGLRKTPVSAKSTTVDDVVRKFLDSTESNFPSLVSNIIRTTGKLGTKQITSSEPCTLCGYSYPQRLDASPESSATLDTLPSASSLCYGCTRLLND